MLKHGIWALAWFLGMGPLAAQEPVPLDLPDRVVLKEGAPLPAGVASRDFRGAVLEEDEERVRVDLSDKKGIAQVVVVPRADLELLERGDGSLREMGLNPERFRKPPFSRPEGFYPGRIAELEAFLRKFPESRERAWVEGLLEALREEAAKAGQGMIRVGTGWFQASGLGEADRAAWGVLSALGDAEDRVFYKQAAGFAEQVESCRSSRFFPVVVGHFQERAARARIEVAQASPLAGRLLDENVARLEKLVGEVAQAGEWLQTPEHRGQALEVLARVAAQWPELAEVPRKLRAEEERARAEFAAALERGQWDVAQGSLQRCRLVMQALGGKQLEAEAWITAQSTALEAGMRMEALRADWEAKRLDGLKERVEEALSRWGGQLPESQREELKAIVLGLAELHRQEERGRMAALLAGGRLDELAGEIGRRKTAMAQSPELAGERGALAEMAVEGAVAALKRQRPGLAFSLVMDAWRIDPGNARAQLALTVTLLGLLCGGLFVLLVVLLVYAVLFNRVNLHFFKRRLKAYRVEEERFQQRQRAAADRSGAADG